MTIERADMEAAEESCRGLGTNWFQLVHWELSMDNPLTV